MSSAGRDDQIVIGKIGATLEANATRLKTKSNYFVQQHLDISVAPQDTPDRGRDVAGRKSRRRDLVQQRLEGVVILAIDQHHIDRLVPETPRGVQTPEAASDYDNAFACTAHTVANLGCHGRG